MCNGFSRQTISARLDWLRTIRRYGFARLTDLPTTDGIPAEIAALFGYLRETNYGRIFDVRAKVDPNNLADTNLGLQAHTDNPYRDPAPGEEDGILTALEVSELDLTQLELATCP